MSDRRLSALERRVEALSRVEGLLAGVFRESASSVDDVLTVTLPGYDEGEHALGEPDGVVWSPRVDDDGDPVYPSAGDVAYVLEASDGRWVALAWEVV